MPREDGVPPVKRPSLRAKQRAVITAAPRSLTPAKINKFLSPRRSSTLGGDTAVARDSRVAVHFPTRHPASRSSRYWAIQKFSLCAGRVALPDRLVACHIRPPDDDSFRLYEVAGIAHREARYESALDVDRFGTTRRGYRRRNKPLQADRGKMVRERKDHERSHGSEVSMNSQQMQKYQYSRSGSSNVRDLFCQKPGVLVP